MIEHWNGSTWSKQGSPNPSNALNSGLSSVSCPTVTSCFAVGIYQTLTEIKTLTVHWNGTRGGSCPV